MKPSEPEWGSQALVDEPQGEAPNWRTSRSSLARGACPHRSLRRWARSATVAAARSCSDWAIRSRQSPSTRRRCATDMAADRMSPPVRGDIESYDVLRTRLTPREGRTDLR